MASGSWGHQRPHGRRARTTLVTTAPPFTIEASPGQNSSFCTICTEIEKPLLRNSNMSDETTINMFWQGPPVPPLVWACMRSFVHHGHRVRVFSYSSLVVPAGVTLEDAHDVHPSRNVLDNHRAIAQHADIFRYHLLYKYGGWWSILMYTV